MKLKIFLLLLLFSPLSMKAQLAKVYGHVADKDSKEAIAFANIYTEIGGGEVKGTTSDFEGAYHLDLTAGSYKLHFKMLGYEEVEIVIKLKAGEELELNVLMNSGDVLLESVVIEKNASSIMSRAKLRLAPADGAFSAPSSSEWSPSKDRAPKAGQLTAGQLNDFQKWDLWMDLQENDLEVHRKHWGLSLNERYTVIVTNANGKAVVDANVQLLNSKSNVIWGAKTDNTGQAELWSGVISDKKERGTKITVNYRGKEYKLKAAIPFELGINFIQLPVNCEQTNVMDVAFVVDATGSMGDEISFLKSELKDVLKKFKKENSEIDLRLGNVFYRDISDEYLVRKQDFSSDLSEGLTFISKQKPGGGGDYPEAMDKALEAAVNELNWSEDARTRLLFVLADAPPHSEAEHLERIQNAIKKAAEKGIRIVPVTASGVNKSMEYLMRSMALASNGTYTFLTNHSGIGGDHIAPTTDQYNVEMLNELMLRLMEEYSYLSDCNEKLPKERDTLNYRLPNVIKTEILNAVWMVQYADSHIVYYDTTSFLAYEDSTIQSPVDTVPKDSISDYSNLLGMQVFPNPATDFVEFALDGFAEEVLFVNLSGKLIQRLELKGERRGRIDVSSLPSGMYLLIAVNRNQKITGKLQVI